MRQAQYRIDQKEAHNKLDTIYKDLFSAVDKRPLSFQEISEEVFKRKNDLASLLILGTLNYELSKKENIRESCTDCKRKTSRHRRKTSILQSINGRISFTRNYFYCRKCKVGYCPSDRELEIIPRKLQFDVQWRALELAVRLPFDEAISDLKKYYDVAVNKKILHKLVQVVSEDLTIVDTIRDPSDIRKQLLEIRNGSHRRTVVVIGIDGAYVPIRPDHKGRKGKRGKGYWREAKGIRIYAIVDKRIKHIMSWHQIQDADKLKEDLDRILKNSIIPLDVARVCVCADGANWIWNRVKEVYPKAKLVLDYYHCSEHLHKFAEAFFVDDSKKLKWLNVARDDLFSGNVVKLVSRLRRMRSDNKEISDEIISLANYLEERKEMTYYNSFKKGGYPIGSGGIESSNKYVCHRRMKLSGAWWKENLANIMLALRSANSNDMLHRIFEKYKKKQIKLYFS